MRALIVRALIVDPRPDRITRVEGAQAGLVVGTAAAALAWVVTVAAG